MAWNSFKARELAKASGWRRAKSRSLSTEEGYELKAWLYSLSEPANAALEDGEWFGFWLHPSGDAGSWFDGTFRHPEQHAEFLLRWG